MVTVAMPEMGNDLFRRYMKSKYVKNLALAGVQVVWIPLDANAVEAALGCDGLLLPGGADVDPALYGETPGEKCGKPHVLRDETEPKLLAAFLQAGKPILGICRGMQLMNVCFGGSLHQDIKDTQKYPHTDFFHRASHTHPVTLTEDSRLREILGAETLPVNSIHHQAVKQLGERLVASALSPDGFVEAVEYPGHPFCLAVQWHPEHMAPRQATQGKLFAAFAEACRKQL